MIKTQRLYFSQTPFKLLALDGAGALLSTFLLGVVMVKWQPFFGMPTHVLYLLAAVPCGFTLFDLIWITLIKRDYQIALRTIACLNIGYIFLSLTLCFWHYTHLTLWGWLYILSEVIIVGFLAIWEWSAANQQKIIKRRSP